MDKREWKKPEIKVLVRTTCEENVLEGCKIWEESLNVGPADLECRWYSGWLCKEEAGS